MSELSCMMEKHANPGTWRENHGGWVGNKRQKFPSRLALAYRLKMWNKEVKDKICRKAQLLILEINKVDMIKQESG